MKRGEVWWGSPTLPGGSRKRRPFLVVSNDAFNQNGLYPKVLVVHLTSVRRGTSYPWEVALPRGTAGLDTGCVVKCAEVYTLLKIHLHEAAGTVPRRYMEQVEEALAVSLGLAPV